MPLGPDAARVRAVAARLEALRDTASGAEDDVLACLVVTGEARPQRVVDDWLDQVVDTLRALGEEAGELLPVLTAHLTAPRDEAREQGAASPGLRAVDP